MTFTFGNDPYSAANLTGSKIDALRMLLKDTVQATANLTDEEILFYLSQDLNLYMVASAAADAIAAKYAPLSNVSSHGSSLELAQKFEHWMVVSDRMRARASMGSSIVTPEHNFTDSDPMFSLQDGDYTQDPEED